jgi:hypothetical protein
VNQDNRKTDIPTKPGKYWVLYIVSKSTQGTLVTYRLGDCGFAFWDGKQWDREDWDFWRGERILKSTL